VSVCRSRALHHTDAHSVIARLQQIHLVADDINSEAKRLSASYEPTLDPFSPSFDKLLGQFAGDFDRYRLDEIVVAAISPIVSDPPNKCAPFITMETAPPLACDLESIGRPIVVDANVPPLAPRPQGVFNDSQCRKSNSTSRWHGNFNRAANVCISPH
jgi:hypothetical protein